MSKARENSLKKPCLLSALLLFVIAFAAACEDQARLLQYEISGATMGTRYNIKLLLPRDDARRVSLQAAAEAKLEAIEQQLSAFRSNSEISVFNANPSTDWIEVSDEFCELVAGTLSISRQVEGAFDVTAGPLVNLWGFGPGSLPGRPPSDEQVALARDHVGYKKLHADCQIPALRKDNPNLNVDLSAYAKGYAVDRIADLLIASRVDNFLIEVGGELRLQGHNADAEKWAVAVEKPHSGSRTVQTVLHLSDTAMATSGDYRNFFEYAGERYSHLIDTRLGVPVRHELVSVTVVNESAAVADAVATALLVLGPEEGPELANRDGIAAYFLVRNESGIEERTTGAFEAIGSRQ